VTFAKETTVSVDKTRNELDALLVKYGASQRVTAVDDAAGVAIVGFTMAGLQVRLRVPLPKRDPWPPTSQRFYEDRRKLPRGWWKWSDGRRGTWLKTHHEQACRSRWRGVLLIVKAKLELIEMGLSTVEREFLADIALPNGRTVGEWLSPQIADAYENGQMPPMLGPARGDQ
jgi:hypothetical protein